MFMLRLRKPISLLLVVAMVVSLFVLLPGYSVAEPGGAFEEDVPWYLQNFVDDVTIFEVDGTTRTPVVLGIDTLYTGRTYEFVIDFAETAELQFAYDEDGVLTYRLPAQLAMEHDSQRAPARIADSSVEAWYETCDADLISVWFADVQVEQAPTVQDSGSVVVEEPAPEPEAEETPEDVPLVPAEVVSAAEETAPVVTQVVPALETVNLIDVYDNITFTLAFVAELTEAGDGFLDFGNDVVVSIQPTEVMALAAGDMSDLSNFVTSVTIWDLSTPLPTQVTPTTPTFIGNMYQFDITFAEDEYRQLAYNTSGVLTYQLPSQLNIQNAVGTTPIRNSNNVIVGWYTIDTTGLVTVWFDNVYQDGAPSVGNYIDNYTNVTITLEILAQLTEGDGSGLDFGNDVVVGITPPVLPPPSLTMSKTSRYDPNTERIYYMITITALGAPVSGIWLTDAPSINGAGISNDPNTEPNAFYGFRYALNGNTNFTPMNVTWLTTVGGDFFSYNFGDLVLAPNNFITIYYYLDIPLLIANNPGLVPSELVYDFTIGNQASVDGNNVNGVTDSTTDHVRKTFPMSKSGEYIDSGGSGNPHQIRWTITVGGGSGSTTALNDGVITDTLGANLFFQTPANVVITLYDNASPVPNAIFSGTEVDFGTAFSIEPSNNVFTFTVPQASDEIPPAGPGTFGNIYQVVIVFYTDINAPPHTGQPSIIYENNVNFSDGITDVGTGGRMPFTPATIGMSKTTSGICGDPTNGYYVEYEITFTVPAGLLGQPLFLSDTLSAGRAGTGVENIPIMTPTSVTAAMADGSGPPVVALQYYLATSQGANNSVWTLYFGTEVTPNFLGGSGFVAWQYNAAVTITIAYQIDLDSAAIDILKADSAAQLTNAVHLINSPIGNVVLSGANATAVGGVNVTDSWPIFKIGAATDDPALFNYTVTIKGGYSSRPAPLFSSVGNPNFTDTFDARMAYVPGTFYVVDTGSPVRYFAPGPSSDFTVSGNVISVSLNTLYELSGPPTSGGTIGAAPPADAWFATRHNFEFHYQLYLTEMGTAIPDLTNTATISVNPGECTFENDHTLSYTPKPLSKTMDPSSPGSDLVHVEIIINPDGSFLFTPVGSTTGSSQITAHDVLTNLMLYTDTIRIYTQTLLDIPGNVWDGNWIPQAYTFNDGTLWSVNIVSQDEVDFVIPNETPVKITYDALVTLPQGDIGEINNDISIFGTSDSAGDRNYEVGHSAVGADASARTLRVFKRDNQGNNLDGALFDLYVTTLPGYTPPFGLGGDPAVITGADGVDRNFYLLLEEIPATNGVAVFSDPWIAATHNFLFLLVETQAPAGFTWVEQNTFFTINPTITAATITEQETALGVTINPISDFVNVTNIPANLDDANLRIIKYFHGLTDDLITEYLQDFQIVVTDPQAQEHVFGLEEALNPDGISLTGIPGTYIITERNYEVPGFTVITNPTLPIRHEVLPTDAGEVLIEINNTYVPMYLEDVTLRVAKQFQGLTDAQINQYLQNLEIVITDPAAQEHVFGLAAILAPGGVVLENVMPGTYFITERNSAVPGFALTVSPALPIRYQVLPTTEGEVLITITNTYVPNDLAPANLRVVKQFNGLTTAQINEHLQNLQIVITDPNNVERVFGLAAILAPGGIVLTDVVPGTYIITERNVNVPGFAHSVSPQLPIRRVIMPTDTGEVAITITNTYTPIPPEPTPPPPTPTPPAPTPTPAPSGPGGGSPQTGDVRQTAPMLVLLVIGMMCMGGAVVYRARKKLFYQGKHL
ncbi:MAG: hypothetical protein FWE28_08920 [Oscillospiraceae bacterium]|nr:hypothetical protein [Oscillospiraceae bacterium]